MSKNHRKQQKSGVKEAKVGLDICGTEEEIAPITSEQVDGVNRYDLRVLLALRRIIRAVDIHSRKLKAEYQITGPQLVCLLTIAEDGPMTSAVLSRAIHLGPSTLVGILDRLEQRELITRQRDVKDRRQIILRATERGQNLAANAPSPLQDRLAEGLRDQPELEQAAIALSLERIVALMEVQDIDTSLVLTTDPLNASVKNDTDGKADDE
ncbi:MarR family winged helix-turn-helix transcriptional regulator [Planctomycetota bacterium]